MSFFTEYIRDPIVKAMSGSPSVQESVAPAQTVNTTSVAPQTGFLGANSGLLILAALGVVAVIVLTRKG